ncbi:MAG: hypothetical protein ACAI38_04950 [Myxococcota bacterium]
MNSIAQTSTAKTSDLVTRAVAEAVVIAQSGKPNAGGEAIRALDAEVARLQSAGQGREARALTASFKSATAVAVDKLAGDIMSGKTKVTQGPDTAKRDLSAGGAPAGRTAMLRPVFPAVADTRHTVTDEHGVTRVAAYDTTKETAPLALRWMREAMQIGEVRRKFKQYKKRVNEIVNAIPDKELAWSLTRFDALATQEGILRDNNAPLVNQWHDGHLTFQAKPTDFKDSTLSREALTYLFKQAMDREEPAERYGWAAARALHDRFHRVAHFMGSTLGERVLKVALKGTPGNVQMGSIWIQEEARHGDIMESCYNAIRLPNEPELKQQGINSVMRPMTDKGAKSMMLARAFAELGAATGYLTLKGNAVPDSNADKALQGIFLDEVYHYVLMRAANVVGYELNNRWMHVVSMLIDSFSSTNQEAADAAVHRLPEFLLIMEVAYAFNAIDKRVDKFLKTLTRQQLEAGVGPVHPKQDDLNAAFADGSHARTIPFVMEQNPDLSHEDVLMLEKRFPGDYKLENRVIRQSDIDMMLGEYRSQRLSNPKYWMAKKGFQDVGNGTLVRRLEEGDGSITLRFKGRGETPDVRVESEHFVSFEGNIGTMTMREIGALIDATGSKQFNAALKELEKTDYERTNPPKFYEEIVRKLGPSAKYQAKPLTIIEDVTGLPKAS